MPKNTLYVTGFTKESKAADLAPDFEKFGELVRLDIPPPRTDDGEKYAFVEYKSTEDCEKALELDGKALPYAKKEGLTVQLARSDPFSSRSHRGGPRGRSGYRGPHPSRPGRGGYGYPSPYPPASRGGYGRGGYGYQSYGYERAGYGGGYGPYPGGDRDGYGGYGGYGGGYGRDDYYGGYDDYRRGPPRDDRGAGYEYRDRYGGERRRPSDRSYESRRPYHGDRDSSEPRTESASHNGEDYGRGRYSRSNSPNRAKSRSRSPSR